MISLFIKLMKNILLIIITFFIVSCGAIVSTIVPFVDLPQPTGESKVGTLILTIQDTTRKEWFTKSEEDNRKIVIQAWYPTEIEEGFPAPYLDQWEKRIRPISEQINVPKVFIHSIKDVKTNSYLNAQITRSSKKYPVVIFSHGLGGMRMQNTIQMEELASNGYVTIAIDHAYDANITLFNDGSSADFRSGAEGDLTPEQFWDLRLPQIYTRVADVRFILDYIDRQTKVQHPFWELLDMSKVGMLGHSFGGGTAIVTSYEDPRIKACVGLDGWIVPIPSTIIQNGINIPLLYIGRPEWDTPLNYLKLDSLILSSKNYSEKIILDQTKHFDYSDTPQFSPISSKIGISGKMPASVLKDTLNTKILTFFNKYIKN